MPLSAWRMLVIWPLRWPKHLDHHAAVLLRHLDVDFLHRLQHLAGVRIFAQDHFGRADLELVALAAHRLDQDGQVQLAAAADQEGVGRVGRLDAQRHIALQLALQALLQLAAGAPGALAAGKGDVFTPKVMRTVGASTMMGGSGRGSAASVIVSPMLTSGMPVSATISPACDLAHLDALQPLVDEDLSDLLGVQARPHDRCAATDWPRRSVPGDRRPRTILPL